MKVHVLELQKTLFSNSASKVILPGTFGEMCILPNHISIVTLLTKGVIQVFGKNDDGGYDDEPTKISVTGGVCSFSDNVASIIVYDAVVNETA